ncbi:MAG: hypothetical protein ACI87W_001184 [Halieaceae bacterium]|jgi:hypothetical protein
MRIYIASMMPIFCSRLVLASLLLSLLTAPAVARQMYRYVNTEGHTVVAYQVPPEFVAGGYEILSETGTLSAVVPRQLGDRERQDLSSAERQERELTEQRERLRKWDESLLLRYSTIEDIEAARDRALRDLRIRVSVLKGKLRSLKQQVENYQAMAADQERLGHPVDLEHLKAIDDLQSEIDSTERAVVDRLEEIATVDAGFDRDVERFSTLLDIVELRKSMASGEHADS